MRLVGENLDGLPEPSTEHEYINFFARLLCNVTNDVTITLLSCRIAHSYVADRPVGRGSLVPPVGPR